MLPMRTGEPGSLLYFTAESFPLTVGPRSPLDPEELQVLRTQYEKEGAYVGIQTKFNFAWVRDDGSTHSLRKWHAHLLTGLVGTHQVRLSR